MSDLDKFTLWFYGILFLVLMIALANDPYEQQRILQKLGMDQSSKQENGQTLGDALRLGEQRQNQNEQRRGECYSRGGDSLTCDYR